MGTVFVKMWNEDIQTVAMLCNETERSVEDEKEWRREIICSQIHRGKDSKRMQE